MELACRREDLAVALARVARVLPARPQKVVYGCIHLEAREQALVATATDGATVVRAEIAITAKRTGSVIVNGSRLSRLVDLLSAEDILLDERDSRLVVTCGTSEVAFGIMGSEEFPRVARDFAPCGTVGSDLFAEAATQVLTSATTDERDILTSSVWMTLGPDALELDATDKISMSWRKLPWSPTSPLAPQRFGIPARVIAEVIRASRAGAEIELMTAENRVGLHVGNVNIETPVVAMDAPDFTAFVTAKPASYAELDRTGLLGILTRVQVLVDDPHTPVTLEIEDRAVRVQHENKELAAAISEQCTANATAPLTVKLNVNRLLAALKAFDTDTVFIGYDDPLKPVFFVPKGHESKEHRQIVMPQK